MLPKSPARRPSHPGSARKPHYFLGIDMGGTKSHALVCDDSGQALGFAEGGPGNPEGVGYPQMTAVLQQITAEALQAAGLGPGDICGAGFGLAGYDWPSERAANLEVIATLGLNCPVDAVNDTVIGLIAGASEGWGVAIEAGTGENCWGWDPQHRTGRVTGSGTFLGEFGGAWSVVFRAVQAVSLAWSRRGPATALTDAFVQLAGKPDVTSLIEAISLEQVYFGSEHAPLVFEIARQGDPVAIDVLRWAAEELAGLACGVIRQLAFEDQVFEIVMMGSLFSGGPLLVEPMQAKILALAPQARFVRLNAPPVAGGVLLGMQCTGLDGNPRRARLLESARALVEKH